MADSLRLEVMDEVADVVRVINGKLCVAQDLLSFEIDVRSCRADERKKGLKHFVFECKN